MKASNLIVNISSRRRICNGQLLFSQPIVEHPLRCGIGFSDLKASWRCLHSAPALIVKADSEQNFGGIMLHREEGCIAVLGSAELASETEAGLFPSRRLKNGVEREMSALTQQRSRAPAQIFAKRKSHITNILINIARQVGSRLGAAAQKMDGGIESNIDAFTGWRIRDNEGKEATEKTGTTKTTTNKMERMQNSGHQQQKATIQEIAPALLFTAISNHILWEAKQ